MNKKILIGAAVLVAAALVWWFGFRRRAVVAVGYAPGVAPSPTAAITTLLATPPQTIANAAITTGINYLLPAVGAGVTTTHADTVGGNFSAGYSSNSPTQDLGLGRLTCAELGRVSSVAAINEWQARC